MSQLTGTPSERYQKKKAAQLDRVEKAIRVQSRIMGRGAYKDKLLSLNRAEQKQFGGNARSIAEKMTMRERRQALSRGSKAEQKALLASSKAEQSKAREKAKVAGARRAVKVAAAKRAPVRKGKSK